MVAEVLGHKDVNTTKSITPQSAKTLKRSFHESQIEELIYSKFTINLNNYCYLTYYAYSLLTFIFIKFIIDLIIVFGD